MPKRFVKHAWASGIQNPEALAYLFGVSLESMTNRLRYLGFLDDPTRPVDTLFRLESPLLAGSQPSYQAA